MGGQPQTGRVRPRWGPTNDNVEEMLEQVAEGTAICFAPSSMALYYARPGLSWVPLTDVEPLRVALAWADGGPLVEAFAAIVRDLAGLRRTSAASPRPR
ncbi:LysR substrate-binding domain-containing protein [Actinomadura luteofluorescens]|uniref:LysR substrate-binding domain-containing protein n=1 Tax=Actinomadura luteofluorescens TaxID=46163 RepID=UPI00362E671E